MVNLGELNIQGIYLGETEIVSAYLGETLVYTNSTMPNYLKFEALEDNSTVTYIPSTVSTAEYSFDGINWQTFDNETVTLDNVGDIVYVKGELTGDQSFDDYAHFEMTGLLKVYGDISTLLFNGQENVKDLDYKSYICHGLFGNCSALLDASKLKLPATTLTGYCYWDMFSACTSLTSAPKLPAKNLNQGFGCYYHMFSNCTSLTTAPKLPATTLANSCYDSMFNGCTSLTTAPELPATTLEENCYYNMFEGCTSLTTAPKLPATTLEHNCYREMFMNCSALSKITTYATEWNESYCTNWVSGVAENGTFENFGLAEIPTGNNGIPTNWTESKQSYTIDLMNQWRIAETAINPNPEKYAGVWESNSNYHVGNGMSTMRIDIEGYDLFTFYIRSNSESSYDYTIVSPLDGEYPTSWNSSIWNDPVYTYAYTWGKETSGDDISNYTKVTFDGLNKDKHYFYVTFGKDGGTDRGNDRGYLIMPTVQPKNEMFLSINANKPASYEFPYHVEDISAFQFIGVGTNGGGGVMIGEFTNGGSDAEDWRLFYSTLSGGLYCDCGSYRYTTSSAYSGNKLINIKFTKNRVIDMDSLSNITTFNEQVIQNGIMCINKSDTTGINQNNYCDVREVKFFNANDEVIADYVAVFDNNGVPCLYDTINETYVYSSNGIVPDVVYRTI